MNGSDLLHIHAVDFFGTSSASAKYSTAAPSSSALTVPSYTRWLPWLKSAYFRTITRHSLKRVAAVICVSEHDYDMFSAIVPQHKLHLVRNGVAIESYTQ